MARASIWSAKFNRNDEFVAVRFMLVNGVPVLPGQPIDKTQFTTRRLRCLYDWRKIRVAPPTLEIVTPTKTIFVKPAEIVGAPKRRGRPRKLAAAV